MPRPKRGEVWLADLGLAAKTRPVLVLSIPFSDQERALFQIVPHTTATRAGRFEIPSNFSWLEAGAFDVQGLRSFPGSVFIRKLGDVDEPTLNRVLAAARLWLGIP